MALGYFKQNSDWYFPDSSFCSGISFYPHVYYVTVSYDAFFKFMTNFLIVVLLDTVYANILSFVLYFTIWE